MDVAGWFPQPHVTAPPRAPRVTCGALFVYGKPRYVRKMQRDRRQNRAFPAKITLVETFISDLESEKVALHSVRPRKGES
jgi:hypothetical protein